MGSDSAPENDPSAMGSVASIPFSTSFSVCLSSVFGVPATWEPTPKWPSCSGRDDVDDDDDDDDDEGDDDEHR